MQLRIRHTTTYAYEKPASASYSEARLTPLVTADQFVHRSRVEVSPTAWSAEYRDYWGTTVTAFEVTEPHSQMTVTATSLVDTSSKVAQGELIDWSVLADPHVKDTHCEFLAMSELVDPHPEVLEIAAAIRSRASKPADAVRELSALVAERLSTLVAATHVSSPAVQTWKAGAGVSHDLAHVTIGGLRSIGVPARFVSGYEHPDAEPAIGEPQVTEPHAWIEWWDGEWVGWDVARAAVPQERHVIVSLGRDFSDNPPLRGIYAAEGPVTTEVEVQVTRLA